MKAVVLIKQVPDTTDVRIDRETNTLIREGVPSIINPFDENAIEAALQLREEHGGKVTVIQPVGDIPWTTWSGGTATGDELPQGCAAVCNFPSVSPGVQGRKFLGVLVETAQANGTLSSAAQTAVGNFVTGLLNGFSYSAETFLPVLMSTKYAAYREIVSGIVKTVVGYQRRRKPGVGA